VLGTNATVELIFSKPIKVVLAVFCGGTGQGSPAPTIGPWVVEATPAPVSQSANKQLWFAANEVWPEVNAVSAEAKDFKTPLFV
jgi:hypothetical protein